LYRIGHSQRIESLAEATIHAELCSALYPAMRDLLLEGFDWSFARKRVALASVGSPPTNWGYQYQYPSDCLKVRSVVVSGDRTPTATERIPFEITANTVNEGKAICCDLADAEVIYTSTIINTSLFTQAFCSALAWAMAKELVTPMAKDAKFATLAWQQAPVALQEAQALDLNERQEDYPTSEFLNVRA
jgi:hypothetical protein